MSSVDPSILNPGRVQHARRRALAGTSLALCDPQARGFATPSRWVCRRIDTAEFARPAADLAGRDTARHRGADQHRRGALAPNSYRFGGRGPVWDRAVGHLYRKLVQFLAARHDERRCRPRGPCTGRRMRPHGSRPFGTARPDHNFAGLGLVIRPLARGLPLTVSLVVAFVRLCLLPAIGLVANLVNGHRVPFAGLTLGVAKSWHRSRHARSRIAVALAIAVASAPAVMQQVVSTGSAR
jgi:hypothetical protein